MLRSLRKLLYNKLGEFNKVEKSKISMSAPLKQRIQDEIQIPVPWGHISGKWWGPKDKRPILALHGWQDNCGTFDPLINGLPPEVPILAIDLPGHGFSSQIPPGLYYNGFDLVILVKRIVNHYGWSKVSLMGHSLGGITSYVYASTYPGSVDFLISFDTIVPMSEIGKHVQCDSEIIDKFLIYDALNNGESEPPSHPFEALDKILHEGSGKSVDLEHCKYINKRNIRQSKHDPNKYYFSRDARLKTQFFSAWFYEKLMKDGHKITCPVMEIRALNDTPLRGNTDSSVHYNIMDVIKKSSADFRMYEIKGSHHLHLNNPERIAELIKTFIYTYYTDDIIDRSLLKNNKL